MTRNVVNTSLCGVLNVDKPPGLTSHDVVVSIRKMARQRKVGHAGTLDPMATGVLLVCLGRATRVSEYLMRTPKVYRAAVRLGVSTTTHDAEGEITGEAEVNVTREGLDLALRQFLGHIHQVPPRYSAVKRDGKRFYELARQGIEVEVPVREVDITQLQIVDWALPVVHVEVHCGPGTYVRALARDLGRALGCGAHLVALRRLSSGSFAVSDAVTLEHLGRAFSGDTVDQYLHPLDVAFRHLPALRLDLDTARRLAMGQAVAGDVEGLETGDGDLARAYAPSGQFVALVYRDEHTAGKWRPRKVFSGPQEIEPSGPLDVRHARVGK
jgi:tRNA pseudouridine55 synthase